MDRIKQKLCALAQALVSMCWGSAPYPAKHVEGTPMTETWFLGTRRSPSEQMGWARGGRAWLYRRATDLQAALLS